MRTRHQLLLAGVFCISASADPAWCGWQTFTTADGVPSNIVSSVLEDHSGNLWFITQNGVGRYNGSAWQVFTTANGLGGHASSGVVDHLGRLWFGGVGVSRYDASTWVRFTVADGLPSQHVQSIVEDGSGSIWVGTFGGGASRYDGSSWRTFTTADGLADNDVRSIAVDRSGNLWFGTALGVSRYDGSSWQTFTTANGLSDDDVYSTYVARSGALWVGTYQGVTRFDGFTWRSFTWIDGMITLKVEAISEDRSGDIWVGGANNGVCRFDGSNWRNYTPADGPTPLVVLGISEDRAGNLWFGTPGQGASRYDESSWRTFTENDGLASNLVRSITEARSGVLWIGTLGGVSRFDGSTWQTFTTADGLGHNDVRCTLEDRSGRIWVGTRGGGVSVYDGSTWRTFTTADGLALDDVRCIAQDRTGSIWVGTFGGGASRWDGSTWATVVFPGSILQKYVNSIFEDGLGYLWFATYDGALRYDGSNWHPFSYPHLPSNVVYSIAEDLSGNLWFGTDSGVSRFDRTSWQKFTFLDGLAGNTVFSIVADRLGSLWFGTQEGLSRFDGEGWRTFTTEDGLGGNVVLCMIEKRSGDLLISGFGGVTRYEPDRVPPITVLLNAPPRLSPSRNQIATLGVAFGEKRVEFSHRYDGGVWSAWSSLNNWAGNGLIDGLHELSVRSRDWLGNVDSTGATVLFEVDATAPVPVIVEPSFGQAVRGTIEISGKATDTRFTSYRVETVPTGADSWADATLLGQSVEQVPGGRLASWDTSTLSDGLHDLRLVVTDSLDLVGTAEISVLVDNRFPFADETSPATISSAAGGNLYTNDAALHLYFPPGAFEEDALVSITSMGSQTDTLASGALQAGPSYQMSWSAPLKRAGTLELIVPEGVLLAVHHSQDGTTWTRLGGTPERGRLALTITEPGEYALFTDLTPLPEGSATLSALSFTPRVFSPSGSFANDHVAIGFTLGKSAPVTARVYNRAGRLVREVISGERMGPGSTLVRWDGRDRAGVTVADGLYLVTVEAMGQTQRSTIAVVK